VDFADGCISPLAYRGAVPGAVQRYKFLGASAYHESFGLLVAQCIQDHLPEEVDELTWAPLSRKRLRERGYDQAQRLARQAGRTLNLPVFPTLEKVRHTKPQSGLEDEESRKANALGAYRLRPDAAVEGKRLVLVDDVVTSGATLCECARCLKQGGAAKVWCVTLARAGSGKNEKSEKNG
jgi:ComF family protein